MRTLSIRISEELDRRLERECDLTGRTRSTLIREALGRYLDRLERERFMDRMVRAASVLRGDPETRRVTEEFAEQDAKAIELAESGVGEVAEKRPPAYGEGSETEPGDGS